MKLDHLTSVQNRPETQIMGRHSLFPIRDSSASLSTHTPDSLNPSNLACVVALNVTSIFAVYTMI